MKKSKSQEETEQYIETRKRMKENLQFTIDLIKKDYKGNRNLEDDILVRFLRALGEEYLNEN